MAKSKNQPPQNIPETTKWLLEFANLMEGPPGTLNPSDEYFKKRKGDLDKDKLKKSCGAWFWIRDKDGTVSPAIREKKFPLNKFKKWVLESGVSLRISKNIIEIRDYPRYEPLRQCPECNREELYCNPKCEKNKDVEFLNREPFKLNLNETTPEDNQTTSEREFDPTYNRPASELDFHRVGVCTALEIIIDINENGTEENIVPSIPYTTQKFGPPLCPIALWGQKKPEFIHDGTLPQAIIAYFLDFYVNQKNVHPYLGRCPGCGRFFIAGKRRGRPQRFCDAKCEDTFNDRTRKENRERMRKYRKSDQLNRMIKRLQGKPYNFSKEEAEKRGYELIRRGDTTRDI